MNRLIWAALVVGLSASPALAEAQEEPLGPQSAPAPVPPEEKAFRVGVDYLLWATGLSPYAIDPTGETLGQTAFAEHRLRVTPLWKLTERLRLTAQADILTGLLAGETTPLISASSSPRDELTGLTSARARQAYAEYRFLGSPERPGGAVRLGLQTSEFGLGLLTNDGDGYDQDWGFTRFGDESLRALIAAVPIAIATGGKTGKAFRLAVAGDLVREDGLASLSVGDRALQGVVILQLIPSPELPGPKPVEAGVFLAYRDQTAGADPGDVNADGSPNPEFLKAFVADAYLSLRGKIGKATLAFAAEGAVISGETTLNRENEDPTDVSDILQGGGVARLTARSGAVEAEIEAGYASGDPNPQDNLSSAFSFDRDYNVSLLMFEEVWGSLTARDATRASDPNTVGVPPDGAELIATDGAVSGAQYAKLTARVLPSEATRIVAAAIVGRASADVVAPFSSFEQGGVFVNYLGGAPSGRALGFEGDLGFTHRVEAGRVPLEFSLQGGAFFPGSALADAAGATPGPVFTVQAGITIKAGNGE
jgi:hypothetical protein